MCPQTRHPLSARSPHDSPLPRKTATELAKVHMPGQRLTDDEGEKRNFRRTSEPQGGDRPAGEEPLFVIQKHDASRLHYDFRLEMAGEFKSWAMPKGPPTDPSQRRLAVPTEDHPLEYADFEGVIPEGEYGAGTIIVWETGTYRNLRADKEHESLSMAETYEDGQIEVWLEGKKLSGGYVLIHTGKGDDSDDGTTCSRCLQIDGNTYCTNPHSVLNCESASGNNGTWPKICARS